MKDLAVQQENALAVILKKKGVTDDFLVDNSRSYLIGKTDTLIKTVIST